MFVSVTTSAGVDVGWIWITLPCGASVDHVRPDADDLAVDRRVDIGARRPHRRRPSPCWGRRRRRRRSTPGRRRSDVAREQVADLLQDAGVLLVTRRGEGDRRARRRRRGRRLPSRGGWVDRARRARGRSGAAGHASRDRRAVGGQRVLGRRHRDGRRDASTRPAAQRCRDERTTPAARSRAQRCGGCGDGGAGGADRRRRPRHACQGSDPAPARAPAEHRPAAARMPGAAVTMAAMPANSPGRSWSRGGFSSSAFRLRSWASWLLVSRGEPRRVRVRGRGADRDPSEPHRARVLRPAHPPGHVRAARLPVASPSRSVGLSVIAGTVIAREVQDGRKPGEGPVPENRAGVTPADQRARPTSSAGSTDSSPVKVDVLTPGERLLTTVDVAHLQRYSGRAVDGGPVARHHGVREPLQPRAGDRDLGVHAARRAAPLALPATGVPRAGSPTRTTWSPGSSARCSAYIKRPDDGVARRRR